MGFSLYNLFKSGLLISNGVAILHPKRFLALYGLDKVDNNESISSLRVQIVGLLLAVSYLKVPLILVNILVIFIELTIGG